MKMLLIRHATRSLHGLGDVSLNPQGQRQAEYLAELVSQGLLPTPSHLISSPKKRARETFASLSLSSQIPVTIDERLDERRQNESAQDFEARVRSFLEDLTPNGSMAPKYKGCAMICSHLDWLELAMVLLPSTLSDTEMAATWSNAEYRLFRYNDGLWELMGGGIAEPRERGNT